MSLKKSPEIPELDGFEGTKIKQIFHPHNTLNGILFRRPPLCFCQDVILALIFYKILSDPSMKYLNSH